MRTRSWLGIFTGALLGCAAPYGPNGLPLEDDVRSARPPKAPDELVPVSTTAGDASEVWLDGDGGAGTRAFAAAAFPTAAVVDSIAAGGGAVFVAEGGRVTKIDAVTSSVVRTATLGRVVRVVHAGTELLAVRRDTTGDALVRIDLDTLAITGTLGTELGTIDHIACDGGYAWLTRRATGDVLRVPRGARGGPTTVAAGEAAPSAVASGGAYVYFTTSDAVRAQARLGSLVGAFDVHRPLPAPSALSLVGSSLVTLTASGELLAGPTTGGVLRALGRGVVAFGVASTDACASLSSGAVSCGAVSGGTWAEVGRLNVPATLVVADERFVWTAAGVGGATGVVRFSRR